MQLTGPPRLAGIDRPYAVAGGPVEDRWEDRSTVLSGRRRVRQKGPGEWWPSWAFQVLVTAGQWLGWRSDLVGDEAGEVDWCPRTRTPEDPTYLPEHTHRVRCVSELPTLEELRLRGADGRGRYSVVVELEGVAPLPEPPDTVRGGWDLLHAEIDPLTGDPAGYAVAPYGRDAGVLEIGTVNVTLLGEDFDLTALYLVSPLLAAARTEPASPYDGDSLGADVALRRPPDHGPPRLGPVFVHPIPTLP